ncbi:MAG: pilus assembly protein, partial [Selenomonadaceae bacterium]|nr:pilus assembly protein [Selenomonadaceae bacterium]
MFKINRPQRGQALILYALLLPTIFIFVGLAFDFGWWYLNLSRLQNAADSAALAGAHQIAKDESSGYLVNLVNEDLTGWTEVNDNEPGDSRKYANNNLSGSDTNSQDAWTANNVTFKHYLIAG